MRCYYTWMSHEMKQSNYNHPRSLNRTVWDLTSSVENTQDSSSVLFQAFWPDLSMFSLILYSRRKQEHSTAQMQNYISSHLFLFSFFFFLLQQSQKRWLKNRMHLKCFYLCFHFCSFLFSLDLSGSLKQWGRRFLINSLFDLLRKISPTALLHI